MTERMTAPTPRRTHERRARPARCHGRALARRGSRCEGPATAARRAGDRPRADAEVVHRFSTPSVRPVDDRGQRPPARLTTSDRLEVEWVPRLVIDRCRQMARFDDGWAGR